MEEVVCTICGTPDSSPLFTASDYITKTSHDLVQCKQCGLVYVNPQPTKSELSQFYPPVYYGKQLFLYEKIDAYFRRKDLLKYLKPNKGVMLEIGCGKGALLKLFKDQGWEVMGIELSENSAKYAKQTFGLNICNKEIEYCNLSENYFDIITLYHSLEHLKDPVYLLKIVKRLLKKDGIVVIQVPRFNSFYSKVFKDNWFHLDVPRHLYHFNDQTLEKLISSAGFFSIKVKKFVAMHDSFGALQSFLNIICSEYNLLNDINTKRISIKDVIKSKQLRLKVDAAISFLAQLILFPPLLLLSLFFSLFNIGGTLTVYARK